MCFWAFVDLLLVALRLVNWVDCSNELKTLEICDRALRFSGFSSRLSLSLEFFLSPTSISPKRKAGARSINLVLDTERWFSLRNKVLNLWAIVEVGTMPAVSTFMSREAAAVFAAASPFANPPMLSSCAPVPVTATSPAGAVSSFGAFADLQTLQMVIPVHRLPRRGKNKWKLAEK